jgi:hypothetical protein
MKNILDKIYDNVQYRRKMDRTANLYKLRKYTVQTSCDSKQFNQLVFL